MGIGRSEESASDGLKTGTVGHIGECFRSCHFGKLCFFGVFVERIAGGISDGNYLKFRPSGVDRNL
jgi:hypothetical protein